MGGPPLCLCGCGPACLGRERASTSEQVCKCGPVSEPAGSVSCDGGPAPQDKWHKWLSFKGGVDGFGGREDRSAEGGPQAAGRGRGSELTRRGSVCRWPLPQPDALNAIAASPVAKTEKTGTGSRQRLGLPGGTGPRPHHRL